MYGNSSGVWAALAVYRLPRWRMAGVAPITAAAQLLLEVGFHSRSGDFVISCALHVLNVSIDVAHKH